MKLNCKQLDNIPSYYKILDIKRYYISIKYISIDIVEQDKGAKIMCDFTNGNRYTALVFSEKHYNEELKKIKQMVYNNLEKPRKV